MMYCEECGRQYLLRWRWFRHIRRYHPCTVPDDWEYRTCCGDMAITGYGRIRRHELDDH